MPLRGTSSTGLQASASSTNSPDASKLRGDSRAIGAKHGPSDNRRKNDLQRDSKQVQAGTPPIAEAIGLGAAIEYITALGLERIPAHEHALLAYATELVGGIPGVR